MGSARWLQHTTAGWVNPPACSLRSMLWPCPPMRGAGWVGMAAWVCVCLRCKGAHGAEHRAGWGVARGWMQSGASVRQGVEALCPCCPPGILDREGAGVVGVCVSARPSFLMGVCVCVCV